MKVLLQRVSQASVQVQAEVVAQISYGWLAFVGFRNGDTLETLQPMLDKIKQLRLFSDSSGKFNLSLQDINGSILIVSQFTLYADTSKGRRPSFTDSAPAGVAQPLYDQFIAIAREQLSTVQTGVFGADMKVQLTNDGPVTVMLEL